MKKASHSSAARAFVAVRESTEHEEIVHVFSDVDIANAATFEDFLTSAFVLGKRTVIDLCGCSYVDSTFLRVVIAAHKLLGNRLQLRVTAGSIPQRVLRVTAIDQYVSTVQRPRPPSTSETNEPARGAAFGSIGD